MPRPVLAPIDELRARWSHALAPGWRALGMACVFGAVVAAALLGRRGTVSARVGAAALVLGVAGAWLLARLVARRRLRSAEGVVRHAMAAADPPRAAAVLRALPLLDDTLRDPSLGSPALAELHLARQLAAVPAEHVARLAHRRAAGLAAASVVLAVAGASLAAWESRRLVEGIDVLLARRGVAPLELDWLEAVHVVATSPDYLRLPPERGNGRDPLALYRGSVVTVRGTPTHEGRRLVLRDELGREEPFLPDGAGGWVARWPVQASGTLRVAARFGDVVVFQRWSQPLAALEDRLPYVHVEGAPRSVRVVAEPSVSVRYDVLDDHGLREVQLVLRAGAREDRRSLSKPSGTPRDRGQVELKATDPFVRAASVPVEVTVQARDDNPTAAGWGKSEPLLLLPPAIGEPEALRAAAIEKARDALVDLLAKRAPLPAFSPPAAPRSVKQESADQQAAVAVVESLLQPSAHGWRLPAAVAKVVRSRVHKLSRALSALESADTPVARAALLRESETAVLSLDSVLRTVTRKDAEAVSLRLADVALELAHGFEAARKEGAPTILPAALAQRVDGAARTLSESAPHLGKLGVLGADLGEIVENGLRRVDRTRSAGDFVHAELAARDLHERLRRPHASFEGGGGPGVESGGSGRGGSGSSGEGGEGEPDELAQEAALEQALDELSREHGATTDEVSQALDKAIGPDDVRALSEEAKKHAEALREAVKDLPKQTGQADTAESASAQARAQAEAMADALEAGRPADAVQSGKGAARSIEEAKKRAADAPGDFVEQQAGRLAGEAGTTVQRELEWAQKTLEELRKKASERAKPTLEEAGKKESKLAERAKALGEKASADDEASERIRQAQGKMEEASRALEQGDGARAQEAQREAQRLLEMARATGSPPESPAPSGQGTQPSGTEEGEGKAIAKKADIPDKKKWRGPEAFRKRVLEGLSRSPDPVLRDALRRYTEGLLR